MKHLTRSALLERNASIESLAKEFLDTLKTNPSKDAAKQLAKKWIASFDDSFKKNFIKNPLTYAKQLLDSVINYAKQNKTASVPYTRLTRVAAMTNTPINPQDFLDNPLFNTIKVLNSDAGIIDKIQTLHGMYPELTTAVIGGFLFMFFYTFAMSILSGIGSAIGFDDKPRRRR